MMTSRHVAVAVGCSFCCCYCGSKRAERFAQQVDQQNKSTTRFGYKKVLRLLLRQRTKWMLGMRFGEPMCYHEGKAIIVFDARLLHDESELVHSHKGSRKDCLNWLRICARSISLFNDVNDCTCTHCILIVLEGQPKWRPQAPHCMQYRLLANGHPRQPRPSTPTLLWQTKRRNCACWSRGSCRRTWMQTAKILI